MLRDWLLAIATGSGIALASAAHCVVMCGSLAVAARARKGHPGALQYALGRVFTYTLLGYLAGSFGRVVYALPWAQFTETLLSWLLGLSLLYAAYRLFRKPKTDTSLVSIGKRPRRNWLGRTLSRVADEPFLLGALSAFLPCGALLSAVLAAAALGTAYAGALAMAAFAVLSGVALAFAGQLARIATLGNAGRRSLAAVMIVGSIVMFARPLPTLTQGAVPSCHGAGHVHPPEAR